MTVTSLTFDSSSASMSAASNASAPINGTAINELLVTDRNRLNFTRQYVLNVPLQVARSPLPLLLYFPGQLVDAADAAATLTNFIGVGDEKGFATAFLQGVGDEDGNCSTGWNVGGTGATSTCTRLAWSEFGCHCACCWHGMSGGHWTRWEGNSILRQSMSIMGSCTVGQLSLRNWTMVVYYDG